jgi:hypothetical protein
MVALAIGSHTQTLPYRFHWRLNGGNGRVFAHGIRL